MGSFRFLHAADIHLDSPLRGLEQYEGAPVDEIRGATRRALENLVDLAISTPVDFVIIAGDIYDGDWKDHNSGLYFVKQMSRLREADIPVIAIRGNHDAANKMTKSLRLPDNVEVLAHRKATTASHPRLLELGVAVHGRSYARTAESDNFVPSYPAALPGLFNIGILHTSLAGAEGHEPYVPCSLEDLASRGYDYWALGHVHERRVVSQDPYIVYPGNTQGRHIREPGAKGCYIVSVDDHHNLTLQFESLDVMRWEICRVPCQPHHTEDDVLAEFQQQLADLAKRHEQMPLAVRVQLTGQTQLHDDFNARLIHWTNQFRSVALDSSGGDVWLEKVKLQTTPPFTADAASSLSDGPLAELAHVFRELQRNEQSVSELGKALSSLTNKLPAEVLDGSDGLRLSDPTTLRALAQEAEPLLRRELTDGRTS